MITKETVITICENALVQKVSGEMVILDAESGQYYTLNEMATIMLELLQTGKSMDTIIQSILLQYDASEDEVQADLYKMTETLLEKGLATFV